MKAVIQRVKRASVAVRGRVIAEIHKGMVALVGVDCGDTPAQAEIAADETAGLRIFADEKGRMNLSVREISGQVLAVPQFTLSADLSRGRRPSFDAAAPPEEAKKIFGHFVKSLRGMGLEVKEGVFGADMLVEIMNDGPVTFIL